MIIFFLYRAVAYSFRLYVNTQDVSTILRMSAKEKAKYLAKLKSEWNLLQNSMEQSNKSSEAQARVGGDADEENEDITHVDYTSSKSRKSSVGIV